MKRSTATVWLIVILLAAFFLRQYRLLDFPYHGDEVDEGDIALDILGGHLALFYPQNEGNEPLYQFLLTPFFALLGDSVIANRFPSVMWSTLFVALMYLYVRVLSGSRRAGVLAAGLTAALWWPTVFGRLGLREISQAVMMTPALIGLVIAQRAASARRAQIAGIVGGICAGLTAYTFLAGRGFPVIVILFLLHTALVQPGRLRERWRALLTYFGIMIAQSAPLFAYLALHPELDFHVRDLSTRHPLAEGGLSGLISNTLATLGMFTVSGDQNWVRSIPGRPVFVGVEGALFYLGVAFCVWRWRRSEYALQLIVVATMLAPNILTEDPPRWTRSIGILPGLIAITILPIEWAWSRLESRFGARSQSRWRINVLTAILLGTLGISIFLRTANDMFRVWIDHPGVYWMTLAFYDGAGKYVNQSPETTPFNYVMDIHTPWREHNIARVVQRKEIALRYSVKSAFVFPDDPRGGRIAFQILGAPERPLLDAFLDLDAPIFVDARTDDEGRRLLRVYAVPRARIDEHLARARANAVFLAGTRAPITHPIQVGDVLQFLGYEIVNPDARPGDSLNVLTFWRVLRRPPSMAIFIHLLDARQQIVAQFDGFQVVASSLAAGDVVVQLHTLRLPGDLPAGDYRLEMGAYMRDDLKRLPLNVGTDVVWLQEWRATRFCCFLRSW
jgi:4-amino-4-deoxy-L-arabinose transferase-like glycosyltransferase